MPPCTFLWFPLYELHTWSHDMSVTRYSAPSFQSRPPPDLLFLLRRFLCVKRPFRPSVTACRSSDGLLYSGVWLRGNSMARYTKPNGDTNEEYQALRQDDFFLSVLCPPVRLPHPSSLFSFSYTSSHCCWCFGTHSREKKLQPSLQFSSLQRHTNARNKQNMKWLKQPNNNLDFAV